MAAGKGSSGTISTNSLAMECQMNNCANVHPKYRQSRTVRRTRAPEGSSRDSASKANVWVQIRFTAQHSNGLPNGRAWLRRDQPNGKNPGV